MVNLIKMFKFKDSTKDNAIEKKHFEILEEIKNVCSEMAKTENWFQTECNDDLIEACIYQREFLNSKYKYLINQLRKENKSL